MVQPRTQMVEWIVSCVTSGLSAPGVRPGSGREFCADAVPDIDKRIRIATAALLISRLSTGPTFSLWFLALPGVKCLT